MNKMNWLCISVRMDVTEHGVVNLGDMVDNIPYHDRGLGGREVPSRYMSLNGKVGILFWLALYGVMLMHQPHSAFIVYSNSSL